MLRAVAVAVPVLNAADAAFTAHYVGAGLATEANPLMAAALAVGPGAFVAAKMAMAVAGTIVLLAFRERPAAKVGLVVTAAVYGAVCAYHLLHAF